MSSDRVPGMSLLYRLAGWLTLLMLLPVVLQVLVADLVQWVEFLAPWLLLGVVIMAVFVLAVRLMRHRFFY